MISAQITIPYHMIGDYLFFLREQRINLEIYFSGSNLDEIQETSIPLLKEKLNYNPSLSIHAPYMDLSPGAVDGEIRKVTEKRFLLTCDIARELNATTIVFHSGFEKWKYGLKADIWLRESIKTWEKMINRLRGSDVTIAIENVFEDEPSNLRLLIESIGSEKMGLCFDTGHFNLFSKVSLVEWLHQTKDHIVETHLHDNYGQSDDHKAMGDGNFPFQLFFNEIKGIDCLYTIEAHTKDSVMKSMEYLIRTVSES